MPRFFDPTPAEAQVDLAITIRYPERSLLRERGSFEGLLRAEVGSTPAVSEPLGKRSLTGRHSSIGPSHFR
jgi:hypothetical protein